MAEFVIVPSEQAARQLCDDLATLDGEPRQEPVDFAALNPRIRAKAQRLYAEGRLAVTAGVTTPIVDVDETDNPTEYRVLVPEDTQAKLDEDDLRPIKRLTPAARVRVAAAIRNRVTRARK